MRYNLMLKIVELVVFLAMYAVFESTANRHSGCMPMISIQI